MDLALAVPVSLIPNKWVAESELPLAPSQKSRLNFSRFHLVEPIAQFRRAMRSPSKATGFFCVRRLGLAALIGRPSDAGFCTHLWSFAKVSDGSQAVTRSAGAVIQLVSGEKHFLHLRLR
jgi:hypothetical protein